MTSILTCDAFKAGICGMR